MKYFLFTIFTVSMLTFSVTTYAAAIVHDPSNLKENIKQYIQLIKQVQATYEQTGRMDLAIIEAEKTVGAISGSRGLGKLLNSKEYQAIRRRLPPDIRRPLDALSRGHVPETHEELGDGLKSLLAVWDFFQDYKELDSRTLKRETKRVKKAQLASNAVGQVMAEQTLKQAGTTNIDNIETLIAEIDESPDLKHTMDLLARMSAEQTLVINQILQLEAAEASRQSRNALSEDQLRDLDTIPNDLEP